MADNRNRLMVYVAMLMVVTAVLQSVRMMPLLATAVYVHFIIIVLINCLLIITVCTVDLKAVVAVSIVPSAMALLQGYVPRELLIFMAAGNFISPLIYTLTSRVNALIALCLSSLLKFVFLFYSANLMYTFYFKNVVMPPEVAIDFNWVQLIAALFGGIVGYVISSRLPNFNE